MATISRTGIAGGSTISPTHITNIIDALDGTSATTTVIASGSFSGSLTGHATSATTATSATSASYALSASYAVTASYALNAGGGGSSFPFTGSAIISGSLTVTGSLNASSTLTGTLNGNSSLVLNLKDVGKTPAVGSFVIPNFQPSTPLEGTIYWDVSSRTLNVYSVASGWTVFIS